MWKYCLDEMDSADKIEDYLKKVTQKDSFNLPSFYINDNYQNSVSSVANSYQTVGVMLAFDKQTYI